MRKGGGRAYAGDAAPGRGIGAVVVESGARTAMVDNPVGHRRPKLTKLTDRNDIETFLTIFGRMMAVFSVDCWWWSYMLAPQLTGKAQKAFTPMGDDLIGDYGALKAAILKWYGINEEAYRQRLCAVQKSSDESHQGVGDPHKGAHAVVAAGIQNPGGGRGGSRNRATSQRDVRRIPERGYANIS